MMDSRLVLAERIPRSSLGEMRSPLESRLRNLASDLEVSVQVEGATSNGFLKIRAMGPDSEVFTELVSRKLGIAPVDLLELEVNDNFKAYVSSADTKRGSIEIEIGPISATFRCEIVKEALAAQLCDGRSVPADRVAQTFCLQEGVPVHVRLTSIDMERRHIETWISDDQVSRFEEWRRQRFHRIIAVGGLQDKIRVALLLSKAERDVIELKELSLMAHSLVCKLGTEAPGIIAKMGRYLSDFRLCAFLPERADRLRLSAPDKALL